MQAMIFFIAALIIQVASICNSTTFWNPLNNACVNQCPWESPRLYYADTSSSSCVLTCPTTPSLYANDFTQSCVSTCPWNTTNSSLQSFYDNYYRRCVLVCPSSPSYYAYNMSTSGNCVQYCPFGTFSLDLNRTCVTSCPNLHFVNYTLNIVQYQCVASCPSNTFKNSTNFCVNATSCPSGLIGDPISQTCVPNCVFNSTIQMYSNTNPNVNLCVYVCPPNYYKQNSTGNNTCVSSCLTNSFIDFVNGICVGTCPKGSYSNLNGTCLPTCTSGYYANPFTNRCATSCTNQTFTDPTSNFCVFRCAPGYFGDITGGYVCVKICSVSTEYGDPVQQLCVNQSNCSSPYVYADDYSRKCVTLCPQSQNTYGDISQNYCTLSCPWVVGNYTFKDNSTQTCVNRCPTNPSSYADSTTKSCVRSCPPNYYAVDATRTCESSCPNNFYINNITRSCVSSCPIDPVYTYFYAINTTNSQCLQVCPVNYLADPTTMSCVNTTCPSSPLLYGYNRTCISICPNGTYAFDNNVTRTCDSTCSGLYLMDYSTRRCVTICPTNPNLFADWPNNNCTNYCPQTYFADSSIRACVKTCNQSVGYLAYTPLRLCLLVCQNNTYSYNGTCISICPNATAPFYYIDTTTKSCVTNCPDYYFKDDNLGVCVQIGGCSNNYYADQSTRTCVQYCNSSLYTYRDNSTMSCVSQCPYGMYGDYSNSSQKVCVIQCLLSGWYTDSSTMTCVSKCPTNPSLYADLNSSNCVAICRVDLDLYAQDINRTCVNPCPNGTYADIYTRRCLTNCLLVPSSYMYVNGTIRTCVLKCPIGFFADNSTRNCVSNCPSGPNYFADWLSLSCVSLCPWTSTTNYYADTSTRTCVSVCPNSTVGNFTYRDKVLRICMSVCSGHQFSDNSTGDCVSVCPTTPDYFGQMSTQTCVYNCNETENTWAQNITRMCVTVCPAGSFADNFTQRCVSKCPDTQLYYGDPSTYSCVLRCPSDPSLYANNVTQTCVAVCPGFTYGAPISRTCEYPKNCSNGYFADNFTKLCVTNCPATQASYADNTSQYCVKKCPNNTFADNSTYTCVSKCPQSPSYFGYLLKCLVSCPNNTYADTPTRLCVVSNFCTNLTWGDPTSQKCVTTCPFNYYADTRNSTKICVLFCPQDYYADDQTKQCVLKCPNNTYGTNTTRKCVEVCPIYQFAQNNTRMCMTNCPNNSYADANVRVCVDVCSATPNLYGNPINNTCVYVCPSIPDLYAENSTRMCTSTCLFNQSTFADTLTRRCVHTCPVSDFTYADNYTRRCQRNCTYNLTVSVLTYADNSSLTCVVKCPSNPDYYADISTGTGLCVPYCPNNTTPRIYSDNSTRICQILCNISLYYYSSNTTGQCLKQCPGGYFADNQSHACVGRCPGRIVINATTAIDTFGYEFNRTCVSFCDGLFLAQNSSRLCVLLCPQLQYADSLLHRCVAKCDGQRRQYADNSTNTCVNICPKLPDTFADNSTYNCVSPCPVTPPYGYNCSYSCPDGTWADNMTRQCRTFCLQNISYQAQFADSYTGRCVQYCPKNLYTYADKLTYSCVSQCPNFTLSNGTIIWNRTFADDSTKTCVQICPGPWTYAENTTRTCVFKCPNNTFGQNNTRQCVQNCSKWSTFAENSTTFCVHTCPQDSFADNNSMRCVANCPPGTFADNSTWRCVIKCPSNPALYGDPSSAVCVVNCPGSLYGDDSSRICLIDCPKTPTIYYAYSPTNRCYLNCLYPYFGQPDSTQPTYGTCQTYCFTGQYKNMTTNRCQDCKVQCTQCVSLLGCRSCITNYYLFNGTCLTGCASGSGSACVSACPINNITQTITYADPLSQSCVSICPIVSGGGSFGLNSTLFCVSSCPITYYASSVTRRCELCVDGCNNCTGPALCFACYPGYIFSHNLCVKQCSITLPYYWGTTCVLQCIASSYLMSDQVTCGACSSICSTCSLIASNCTKCVGAYLFNYNCVSQCPTNYYPDGNLSCQACTATVTQCNISPLTYVLSTFNQNGQLYGILTFNRATSMDMSKISQIIKITIPGLSVNQYGWSASQINSTSYKINIQATVSLNQLSLTLTFTNPALVIDSAGGSLTSTTTSASLPTYDYISPSVAAATKSAVMFSGTLSWIALTIMLILLFKGSYTLLMACEVFQMVYFHYFVLQQLPYNFSNFLIGLNALDFQFLPNILNTFIPLNFASSITPTYFVQAIIDITFFISSGQYMIIIIFYAAWAFAIVLLKNKSINKFDRLRKFAKGVFYRRIRYGAVNQCIWFCYMSFVIFGFWQLKDLTVSYSWSYANILVSIICWVGCLLLTVWVIFLAIKYRKDMTTLPKKYSFIMGQDSHIPFQMPLRHIRKFLFCLFIAVGTIQTQIITIIGCNCMILCYYLFFKPSKSRFSNWINICIEMAYIGLETTIILFVNLVSPTTDVKITYGNVMIGFSITALLLIVLWLVWQFLLFLYDFKFVRDIIEETRLANQIYPEEDNLKVELDKQYQKDQIIQESISDGASRQMEEETIEGIEKQYNQVVHYVDEKEKIDKKQKDNKKGRSDLLQNLSNSNISQSNQPRLISSRASSRMLFADINIEDIE